MLREQRQQNMQVLLGAKRKVWYLPSGRGRGKQKPVGVDDASLECSEVE